MKLVSKRALGALCLTAAVVLAVQTGAAQDRSPSSTAALIEHRVLATNKTSTMEKELNDAVEAGFRFLTVMGGESVFGGKEVVAVMSRAAGPSGRFGYKLLATSKTSTMQKELQEASAAGASGFEVIGMTVSKTALGGKEMVAITRRPRP